MGGASTPREKVLADLWLTISLSLPHIIAAVKPQGPYWPGPPDRPGREAPYTSL